MQYLDLILYTFSYFTLPKEKLAVEKQDELMHTDWGKHCMAHNGWVMNDDPLRNFAEPGKNVQQF